ncbi:MAG: hypothetical protein MAG795_00994 [Candidatus Woesearchaeota archaeon]|nr:hypothetical protein [Candidatus Woesearchaeota archaeon]
MTVVGMSFTKINIEKKKPAKGKLNIKNNIAIRDVKQTDLSLGNVKEQGLKFIFEYTSNYSPDVAEINIVGEVLFLTDEKTAKETEKNWKDEKKIAKKLVRPVLNSALTKSNIQAIMLSKEINLPPPIPLPKVESKNQNYIR